MVAFNINLAKLSEVTKIEAFNKRKENKRKMIKNKKEIKIFFVQKLPKPFYFMNEMGRVKLCEDKRSQEVKEAKESEFF